MSGEIILSPLTDAKNSSTDDKLTLTSWYWQYDQLDAARLFIERLASHLQAQWVSQSVLNSGCASMLRASPLADVPLVVKFKLRQACCQLAGKVLALDGTQAHVTTPVIFAGFSVAVYTPRHGRHAPEHITPVPSASSPRTTCCFFL